MLKNRVFYGVLLLLAAFIYIFTNTYYTLTVLLALIALPLISMVLMLIAGTRLVLELNVPQTMTSDEAEFVFHLENKSPFPIAKAAMSVVLENQMTGFLSQRNVLISIGGNQTIDAKLGIEEAKAGTVLIGAQKVRIYDSFGIGALKKTPPGGRSTIIYPDMQPVMVQMERPTETLGEVARYAPDKPGSDVSEIFALREYALGDEIRKIHWKLSSKLDKTMVRDFSLPLSYSIILMMELVRADEAVLDAQISLYLSLSRALLENGMNHNLAWYNSGSEEFCVRELNDFEDLELVSAQVLSSYAYEDRKAALNFYMAGEFRSSATTLLYVTADPDLETIAELKAEQDMRTIWICKNRETSHQQQGELIPVTVSQIRRGAVEFLV